MQCNSVGRASNFPTKAHSKKGVIFEQNQTLILLNAQCGIRASFYSLLPRAAQGIAATAACLRLLLLLLLLSFVHSPEDSKDPSNNNNESNCKYNSYAYHYW